MLGRVGRGPLLSCVCRHVCQDDHQNTVKTRVPALVRSGIRYAMAEDNYQIFDDNSSVLPTSDHYSLKMVFARKDPRYRPLHRWLSGVLQSYAEVPPLIVPSATWPANGTAGVVVPPNPQPHPCILDQSQRRSAVSEPMLRPQLRPTDATVLKKVQATLDRPLVRRRPSAFDPRRDTFKFDEEV